LLRRKTRADLWICGQRKSVAHIPTGPTAEAAGNLNLMKMKKDHQGRSLTRAWHRGRPLTTSSPDDAIFARFLKAIHTVTLLL
jgi:hypothetical protein